jgi:hypothetical protein
MYFRSHIYILLLVLQTCNLPRWKDTSQDYNPVLKKALNSTYVWLQRHLSNTGYLFFDHIRIAAFYYSVRFSNTRGHLTASGANRIWNLELFFISTCRGGLYLSNEVNYKSVGQVKGPNTSV